MIFHYFELFIPQCAFCGHRLPAEYSDAEAEAAMRTDGWAKRDGKDVCRLCQRKGLEGNEPRRRCMPAPKRGEPREEKETVPAPTGDGKKREKENDSMNDAKNDLIEQQETLEEERRDGGDVPNGKEQSAEDGELIGMPAEAESSPAEEETDGLGSLDVDTVRCIAAERARVAFDTGERYNSGFESYGVLTAALEKKTAVEKDLKDGIKSLWEAVKEEDDTTTAAYLKEIERVARRSAMAWIHVAAIAQKAEESL